MAWLDGTLRHGSGHHGPWWRSRGVIGEAFQVLDGGGQQELVAGAGQAPQSEPDHREDMLGLAEEPFDLLAFRARRRVSLGLHQGTGMVACRLVQLARDPARRCVGTAFRLQRTGIAITLARAIAIGVVGMAPAGGRQGLAAGTDVAVARRVVDEVGPREGAIVAFALVPDRDVRRDVMVDQPAEHLARAIGDGHIENCYRSRLREF